MGTVTIAELLTQKDSSELLLITEPELSLRDRRSEWLCGGFLCDHPARSTAEYAMTLPIALMPPSATPIATTSLMVNCLRLRLLMVSVSIKPANGQSNRWRGHTVAHRPWRRCEFEHTGGPKSVLWWPSHGTAIRSGWHDWLGGCAAGGRRGLGTIGRAPMSKVNALISADRPVIRIYADHTDDYVEIRFETQSDECCGRAAERVVQEGDGVVFSSGMRGT